MSSQTVEKENLLQLIDELPNQVVTEILDFALFLKQKSEQSKFISLQQYKDKIIQEDNELLKKLAK